jgi:two-component system sensor histidine kinase KdpD
MTDNVPTRLPGPDPIQSPKFEQRLPVGVGPKLEAEHAARWAIGSALRRTPKAQYLTVFGTVAAVTGAAFFFTPVVGPHATALVFLLVVVGLALLVDRGPALFAATLSALAWDYFFLPPVFAFEIHSFEDAMLFGMSFVVALALGQLTSRIKAHQVNERQREARATALYVLTSELNEARTLDDILAAAKAHLQSALQADDAIVLHTLEANSASPGTGDSGQAWKNAEMIRWVIENGRPAGKSTDKFGDAQALYIPLSNSAGVVGVVALRLEPSPPVSLHQWLMLESFSEHIAVALDRLRLSNLSEQARVLMESERLSKTLLDSMTHELRTPIAAIRGATGNILQAGTESLSSLQQAMITEIGEATQRLDRLVGNALELNRLEAGALKPLINYCDPAELVNFCIAETEKELEKHTVDVAVQPNLPMIRMDFVLTQQALSNLLANAAAHTPAGTAIDILAAIESESLVLSVADRGPGIDPSVLPRIFDKFVRGPNARPGGTGLGLSLVRGFIEAQGGSVAAVNRPGGGALFSMRLPLRKE